MSNQANEILLIRANELAEELASDPAGRDDRILKLIKDGDLDNLLEFIQKIEAQLAIEHFHEYNLVEQEAPDVY